VGLMCETHGVSRTVSYAWLERPRSRRAWKTKGWSGWPGKASSTATGRMVRSGSGAICLRRESPAACIESNG
jgi:hypothetical protein